MPLWIHRLANLTQYRCSTYTRHSAWHLLFGILNEYLDIKTYQFEKHRRANLPQSRCSTYTRRHPAHTTTQSHSCRRYRRTQRTTTVTHRAHRHELDRRHGPLQHVTNVSYIQRAKVNPVVITTSQKSTLLTSQRLKSQLSSPFYNFSQVSFTVVFVVTGHCNTWHTSWTPSAQKSTL